MADIMINSAKLEAKKKDLKYIKNDVLHVLNLMKKYFDQVGSYWEGPKAEEFIEETNKFWNGGKSSNSVPIIEYIDLEFQNLIAFIEQAIKDTNATDVKVEESLKPDGAQSNSTGSTRNDNVPETATAAGLGAATTAAATENDEKVDAAPPAKETSETSKSSTSMNIPSGTTSWKGYSDYREVTDKSTPAYAIVNGKTSPYGKYEGTTYNTKTDNKTGIRYVTFEGDDTKYYCAALGTYYGEEGDTFKVTTDDGNTFNVIMCDSKGSDSVEYGNGKTYYHDKGSDGKEVVEFYIDYYADDIKVYRDGEYIGTTGNYGDCDQFSGNITSIEKLS